MKSSTAEERTAAVKEAKRSAKYQVKTLRTMDYELCEIITHNPSRYRMKMLQMGFYFINKRNDRDIVTQ